MPAGNAPGRQPTQPHASAIRRPWPHHMGGPLLLPPRHGAPMVPLRTHRAPPHVRQRHSRGMPTPLTPTPTGGSILAPQGHRRSPGGHLSHRRPPLPPHPPLCRPPLDRPGRASLASHATHWTTDLSHRPTNAPRCRRPHVPMLQTPHGPPTPTVYSPPPPPLPTGPNTSAPDWTPPPTGGSTWMAPGGTDPPPPQKTTSGTATVIRGGAASSLWHHVQPGSRPRSLSSPSQPHLSPQTKAAPLS